jgi:YfiH family protein
MFFSLGPALGETSKIDRVNSVLGSLGPQLRAVRWCEQIHGRLIASLGEEPGNPFHDASCVGRCDALITSEVGVGLLVWTADCVPVLITGGEAVAAIHIGWRGAAADIVGAVVRRYAIEYGVHPKRLQAYLGPSISGTEYQVGNEVIEALRVHVPEESGWRTDSQVDLRNFLTARLTGLGLAPPAISKVGPCTASSSHLASFRRDGVAAGRQWSMVYGLAGD